jgi:hypothetical protein
MSHFYGVIRGRRGKESTRCGDKSTELVTYAAGWGGAVRTTIWHDEDDGRDYYNVSLVTWPNKSFVNCIEEGELKC